jgi:hypothetical protein
MRATIDKSMRLTIHTLSLSPSSHRAAPRSATGT